MPTLFPAEPRLGARLPAIGTIVSPGPRPGTWWAVPEPGEVAGRVVDANGRVVDEVTAAEQATRLGRADAILTHGAIHVPDKDRGPGLVHLTNCPDIPAPRPHGATGLHRAVARVALHGRPVMVPPPIGWRQVPAAWCPTCLPDTPTHGGPVPDTETMDRADLVEVIAVDTVNGDADAMQVLAALTAARVTTTDDPRSLVVALARTVDSIGLAIARLNDDHHARTGEDIDNAGRVCGQLLVAATELEELGQGL